MRTIQVRVIKRKDSEVLADFSEKSRDLSATLFHYVNCVAVAMGYSEKPQIQILGPEVVAITFPHTQTLWAFQDVTP